MAASDIPSSEVATAIDRTVPGSSELYAEWAARMQRGRGRHAAISRNLYTWSNYKSWSERMRVSWDVDAASNKPK
jgi:hypothetical protein